MNKLRKAARNLKKRLLNTDTQTPFEKLENNEYILVSFPKSGRTWVQILLQYLGITVPVSHDGSGHVPRYHFKKLIKDKSSYANNKVIFLIREPKDTVISGYFHAVKRKQIFKGGLDEFIKSPRHGIEKIVIFNSIWYRNKEKPKGFHLIQYENLHKDAFQELKKLLEFMNRSDIADEKIREAIEFGKFDNMHKLEKEGYFKDTFGEGLTPKNINDTDSFKTRKGKVGGYKEYLKQEQIDYCDSIIKKHNYPF